MVKNKTKQKKSVYVQVIPVRQKLRLRLLETTQFLSVISPLGCL